MLGKIRKSLKSSSNPFSDQPSKSPHSSFKPLDPTSPSQNTQNASVFNFKNSSPTQNIKYGCLVVLGANGRTPLSPTDPRQKSCFLMEQQDEPNGIIKIARKVPKNLPSAKQFDENVHRTHSITYSLSRTKIRGRNTL